MTSLQISIFKKDRADTQPGQLWEPLGTKRPANQGAFL